MADFPFHSSVAPPTRSSLNTAAMSIRTPRMRRCTVPREVILFSGCLGVGSLPFSELAFQVFLVLFFSILLWISGDFLYPDPLARSRPVKIKNALSSKSVQCFSSSLLDNVGAFLRGLLSADSRLTSCSRFLRSLLFPPFSSTCALPRHGVWMLVPSDLEILSSFNRVRRELSFPATFIMIKRH